MNPVDAEVNEYLKLRSSVLDIHYNDALQFWRENSQTFPHIAKTAHHVLSVSGSAASERIFALVKQEIEGRGNLKTSTVEDYVHMKFLKKFEDFMNA